MNTPITLGKLVPECPASRRSPDRTVKGAWLLSLAVSMIAATSQVFAQADNSGVPGESGGSPSLEEGTGIKVSLVKAGGEPFDEAQRFVTPIGLAACIEGTIEVSITDLPSSPEFPHFEVWFGTGDGECNRADRSSRINPRQNCTKLEIERDDVEDSDLTYLNATVQVAPVCELNEAQTSGARQGPQKLWFLLLRNQDEAEEAEFYRELTINIDTSPPDAPTSVEAEANESQVHVSWENTAPNVREFFVAADYSAGAAVDGDDGCKSDYLRAGMKFDRDASAPGFLIRSTETNSNELWLGNRELEGALRVAVAVAAVDSAGNVGVMSEVKCVNVPQALDEDDFMPSQAAGCACFAPGKRGGFVLGVLSISLFLLGSYARRRRARSDVS